MEDAEVVRIVEKWDLKLHEYDKHVVSQLPSYMATQRQPFEPFFQKLFGLYTFASFLVDSKPTPDDDKFIGLRILFAKASLSLFGILSCLKNGLSSEGGILLRSLFETFVAVKLILEKDTDLRLKLYYEYRFVEQWNGFQSNKHLLASGKTTEETFDKTFTLAKVTEIENNYNSVKANYHPTHPFHWAWSIYHSTKNTKNPSIKLICDQLGLADDYVKVYGVLSSSVHNSANVLNIMQTQHGISLAPKYSKSILTTGSLATGYCIEIIHELAEYFKWAESEEIHVYSMMLASRIYDEYGVV